MTKQKTIKEIKTDWKKYYKSDDFYVDIGLLVFMLLVAGLAILITYILGLIVL